MSDFKVGDKITRPTWEPGCWFMVEWVGDLSYAGRRESGSSANYSQKGGWVKWTPPFPFKVGDRISLENSRNPQEFWYVGDVCPGKYTFQGRSSLAVSGGLDYPLAKEPSTTSWVKWVPPFHFKFGDVLRRSKDSVDGNHWEVVDPLPGSPSFMGRIIRSGNRDLRVREELTPYQKVCNNGEWELVPPTPTKKEFRLLTELRLPNQGETYVYGPFILVATRDHRSDPQYVVTNVRPLDRV